MDTRERAKIVVVNDDRVQLRSASALLARDGFDVLSCERAEEALQVMRRDGPVDIIVTDLHMPGIDGWRLCQLLRSAAYAEFNKVPILVLSATFAGTDAEEVTSELGANAFLSTPYEAADLRASIRDLLEGRRPQSQLHALVIEGVEHRAQSLQDAFEAHGYVVRVASSSEDAFPLLRPRLPDVAVVNSDRVSSTGPNPLLRTLKEPGSPTVVILITSDDSPTTAVKWMQEGVDGYLRIPFDSAYMLDLCRKARRQRCLMRVEELLERRTRELRDSEARFRALFEGIREAVLVHDENEVILHVNAVGAERLQRPAADLVGEHVSGIVLPGGSAPAFAAASGVLEETRRAFESTWVARNGQHLEVEVSQSRIDFEGRPAILSVARDISAKKELERQRADFLAMLIHDIRGPVGVILGATELLLGAGPLSAAQREMAKRIEMASEAVLSLVANQLEMSSIEAGELRLSRQRVELADLLGRVSVQFEAVARRRHVTLKLDLEQGLPELDADRTALERVFANLIQNALKFTPDSGQITISCGSRDGELVTTVADTGPGIGAEEIPWIFDRYRRGAAGRGEVGTGLGLFISQKLVQAHGGRIEVKSDAGAGSRFTVFLPCHSGAASKPAGGAPAFEPRPPVAT